MIMTCKTYFSLINILIEIDLKLILFYKQKNFFFIYNIYNN